MEPMPRLPNGLNVKHLLLEYGVRILPIKQSIAHKYRPANVVYGGRTIARLMKHDSERVRTVIACIQASNPKFYDDVMVYSIWRVISSHFAHMERAGVVSLFAAIDIGKVHKRAQRLVSGQHERLGNIAGKIDTLITHLLIEDDQT